MRGCRSARGRPETAVRETKESPLLQRLYQFVDDYFKTFDYDINELVKALKESPLLQRLYQFVDVVVEGLEIVIEAGLAADGRVEHDHLRAGFFGDRLRRLAVEVWLHDDGLDAIALDELDEIERVRRRRRNARLR